MVIPMPPHPSAIRALLPSRADYPSDRAGWRRDALAGLTVGVVAIPLALGFGVSSGAGASAGLITAIVAGFVAAVFGGSGLQVSGPTGAMTIVLLPVVASHGVSALPTLAVLAGAFVVIGSVLRVGRAVALVPWPVVEGFTTGIAVVIALQQVASLLAPGRALGHDVVIAAWDAARVTRLDDAGSGLIVAAVVVTIAAVLGRVRPTWPSTLVALVIASGAAAALDLDVATVGALDLAVRTPDFSAWFDDLASLVRPAAVIALLAALESLLSARVADGMSDSSSTDPDRELLGQGLANVAAGLVGGIPATGAIARTAVNVRAGARTRVAAATHAVVVLVLVVAAAPLVARVPLAALSGVLLFTAARMVDRVAMRALLGASGSDAAIYVATAIATVALDLVRAVEIGVAISIVLALRSAAAASDVTHQRVDDLVDDDRARELLSRHVLVYRLEGALFFAAAQRFLDRLTHLDHTRVVVLRLGFVHVLDSTGAHLVAEQVEALRSRGIAVLVCGVQPRHERLLAAVGIPGPVLAPDFLFTSLPDALEHALGIVSGPGAQPGDRLVEQPEAGA